MDPVEIGFVSAIFLYGVFVALSCFRAIIRVALGRFDSDKSRMDLVAAQVLVTSCLIGIVFAGYGIIYGLGLTVQWLFQVQ